MESGSDLEKKWRFMDDFWFNVTFVCHRREARTVFLAGDFSGWRPDLHAMRPCSEGFSVSLSLCEGFYEYKFLVDGEWLADEHNPHTSVNYGNSIMFVHIDPSVYGPRVQESPHREFQPPGGNRCFQTLSPSLPPNIASWGVPQRLIFVYLPPSYFTNPQQRFPVLYCNDGQNIFSTPQDRGAPNGGGWYLDAKLEHLWSQGALPEFIIVGVPNSDFVCRGNRCREYCAGSLRDTSRDLYTRYLAEVVKREIDSNYRTLSGRDHTFILGASMGGLQAFVTGLNWSNLFGGALCFSPAFWFVDKTNSSCFDLVNSLELNEQGHPHCRLYIDAGDCKSDNCYVTKLMHKCLLDNGWKEGEEFQFNLEPTVPNADMHGEWAWRERVPNALKFIFEKL